MGNLVHLTQEKLGKMQPPVIAIDKLRQQALERAQEFTREKEWQPVDKILAKGIKWNHLTEIITRRISMG